MVSNRQMTFKGLIKSFKNTEKAIPKELGSAIYMSAKEGAIHMRDVSERSRMKYRGNYARAWKARRVRLPLTAETYNNVRNRRTGFGYAPTIENGQPPGIMPSERDIKPWVRDKLKVPAGEVDAVTRYVRWAIYKKGIPSNPAYSNIDFHTNQLEAMARTAKQLLDRAMQRALTRL